ncbi:MAG: penicillin-binding protein 1B [Acidobacteria bacterium]|nr:MAG: penicillin-binding protein 1B [Acidobacteriota bacterium]
MSPGRDPRGRPRENRFGRESTARAEHGRAGRARCRGPLPGPPPDAARNRRGRRRIPILSSASPRPPRPRSRAEPRRGGARPPRGRSDGSSGSPQDLRRSGPLTLAAAHAHRSHSPHVPHRPLDVLREPRAAAAEPDPDVPASAVEIDRADRLVHRAPVPLDGGRDRLENGGQLDRLLAHGSRSYPTRFPRGDVSARRSTKSARRRRSGRTAGARARRRRGVAIGTLALASAAALWLGLALWSAGERAVASLERDPPNAPVEILAAPRVLRVGRRVDLSAVAEELAAQRYRAVPRVPARPGEYRISGNRLEVYRRPFTGPHGYAGAAFARVTVDGGRAVRLEDASGRPLGAFTLEPVRLGAYHGPELVDRRPLPLDRYPPRLVQAVVAAEDARFMRHRGIDLRAVLRAAWADIRGGGLVQGGSTITQQVVKNRLLGHQRTWMRKLREAILALYVERRVSKRRILEIYLNEVYLGQEGAVSIVGMPAAALHYFGKDISDLTLDEQAMLAGLIASPGRFDPRRRPEAARARRNWVLERMEQIGAIDPAERERAAARPLGVVASRRRLDPAGDLLDAVQRELVSRGWEPRPGEERARVFTTIDPAVQRAAREALRSVLDRLEREDPRRAPLEGAVVVLRPASGEILAIVGGRKGSRGAFNRALDAHRQPGSAFKPFVALTAFIEGHWQPSSLLADEPIEIRTANGLWRPRNVDGRYRGTVTLRQAIEESLNVPMAWLGRTLGAEAIRSWARLAGIRSPLPSAVSLALGTGEVTPLELAVAYGTIGNLGKYQAPRLVRGVRTADGAAVPLEPMAPPENRLPPEPCYLVLDMMAGAAEHGTARGLASAAPGVRVAAKTGTTQDGRDAWGVLVTGDTAAVCWVGRDDGKPARLYGAGAAIPVLAELLRRAGWLLLAPLPDPPPGVVEVTIDPDTGGLATWRCPRKAREVFTRDRLPVTCPRHRGFFQRFFGRRLEPDGRGGGAGRDGRPAPGLRRH